MYKNEKLMSTVVSVIVYFSMCENFYENLLAVTITHVILLILTKTNNLLLTFLIFIDLLLFYI